MTFNPKLNSVTAGVRATTNSGTSRPRPEPVAAFQPPDEPAFPPGREPGCDDEPAEPVAAPRFMLPEFSGCTESELGSAQLHPKCIVENIYYADVGALFAPGGVGKTTVKIYESICIALGRDLWGCLLYTSPSPRDRTRSRMPSSA